MWFFNRDAAGRRIAEIGGRSIRQSKIEISVSITATVFTEQDISALCPDQVRLQVLKIFMVSFYVAYHEVADVATLQNRYFGFHRRCAIG